MKISIRNAAKKQVMKALDMHSDMQANLSSQNKEFQKWNNNSVNTEHFKICDFVIFFNLFFSQGPAAPAEMPGLRKPESPLKEFDKVGFRTSGCLAC